MPTIAAIRALLTPHDISVLEFDQPTPTAEAAAAAVGCSVAEIAKTMLVLVNGQPVVVIAPGDRKLSSSLLKQALGASGKVVFPAADVVERLTGYAPGGVSPFLLPPELPVLLDRGLRRFVTIYPAAGTANSAVPLSFVQLQQLTNGREADLCPE